MKEGSAISIGFLQFAPQKRTEHENVKYIGKMTRGIRNAIIVLPEFFLSSYQSHPLLDEEDLRDVLAPLARLSEEQQLAFAGSLPVRTASGNFNRAIYIHDGDIRYVYDKVRLFGAECEKFDTGSSTDNIIEFDGVKCNVQICMDIVDPLPLQSKRLRPVQIVLGPSSVSVDFLRVIHKARALENQLISVFCNRCGVEPGNGVQYLGSSGIFFPDGTERSVDGDREELKLILTGKEELETISARRQLFLDPRREGPFLFMSGGGQTPGGA